MFFKQHPKNPFFFLRKPKASFFSFKTFSENSSFLFSKKNLLFFFWKPFFKKKSRIPFPIFWALSLDSENFPIESPLKPLKNFFFRKSSPISQKPFPFFTNPRPNSLPLKILLPESSPPFLLKSQSFYISIPSRIYAFRSCPSSIQRSPFIDPTQPILKLLLQQTQSLFLSLQPILFQILSLLSWHFSLLCYASFNAASPILFSHFRDKSEATLSELKRGIDSRFAAHLFSLRNDADYLRFDWYFLALKRQCFRNLFYSPFCFQNGAVSLLWALFWALRWARFELGFGLYLGLVIWAFQFNESIGPNYLGFVW